MSMQTALDQLPILDPDYFGAHGYPHDAWTRLRRESPVHHFPNAAAEPFWAVTRHQDIVSISKQPERFANAPRLLMPPANSGLQNEFPVRMLLNMDNPDHRVYRNLMHGKFSPQALRNMPLDVEGIAREIVDQIDTGGAEAEIDFVSDVSAYLPIAVVADLLGVPRSDWRTLFRWTNEVIGSGDPEYQREGENQQQAVQRTRLELFKYFTELIRERREHPRDDIVSHLAKAKIDGKYLPDFELLSYYFLLVVAGNETTRNAMTGGLLAFIENPGEWRKLAPRPDAARLGRRGDRALDDARDPVRAHAPPRTTSCAARRSARASGSVSSTRRRIATRTSSTSRSASGSTARPTTTSASASASTSAWARTSRGSSCA